MSEQESSLAADVVDAEPAPAAAPVRKRPKPGERRIQILQTLAAMLEQPGADRITTAALAAQMSISEAALYRHFASKAQMYEGLIDFIEQSVFTLAVQITGRDVPDPAKTVEQGITQAHRVVTMVLQFGERNPGMVRVMMGDALQTENPRLQQRMQQFFERIEATLRQCLRTVPGTDASATPMADAQVRASLLMSFLVGRLQRFGRSDFRKLPTEQLDACLALMRH